jgi:propionyl-CoA synthetase
MEEIVAEHKDIAECAVLGIADEMKGQIPAGFIVLSHGTNRDIDEIQGELVKMVRERIGPVAAFKTVVQVKRLPKTRSGKILRATVQKLADGQEFKVPAILDELREALEARGIL